MKRVHETFTDEEFQSLLHNKGDSNWHDFIMLLLHWDNDTQDTKEDQKNGTGQSINGDANDGIPRNEF